jgi:transcriptional regulator with XRE-family HTH domain
MKRITQKNIALTVGISAPYLNQILKGIKRPMWPIAKRLSLAVPGSTPEDWLEAPPEALRKIINEYTQQERSDA